MLAPSPRTSGIQGNSPGIIPQSDPDFEIAFAITIAIENRSGKISDRFSFVNRSAILILKSISDFHFQIDQRLKTGFRPASTDRT
jgi:hypothetical protein